MRLPCPLPTYHAAWSTNNWRGGESLCASLIKIFQYLIPIRPNTCVQRVEGLGVGAPAKPPKSEIHSFIGEFFPQFGKFTFEITLIFYVI